MLNPGEVVQVISEMSRGARIELPAVGAGPGAAVVGVQTLLDMCGYNNIERQ